MAFDVTPLQNAHRIRGIGRYVRGLATALNAQQEFAIEFWGWGDDRPFEVRPPHRGLWLRRFGLPRTRWSWLTGPIGMRVRRRLSRTEVTHITDPRAFTPLGVKTLTTVYDLIPLLDPDWNRNDGEWRLQEISRSFAQRRRDLCHLQPNRDRPAAAPEHPPAGGPDRPTGRFAGHRWG